MIRPLQDNVLILLEPDGNVETASGVVGVSFEKSKAYAHRKGRVLAVGPGHYDRSRFLPTETKVGERVIVPVLAGDNYSYQKRQDFAEMYGLEGDQWEVRMVREAEILAVIEDAPEVREGLVAAE